MQKKEKFNFHRICLGHHYGRRFIVLGLWTPIWPPWRHIANGHHPRETYNTRHKSLKQTPFDPNFLENFLHPLFALLFSLKCGPFFPNVELHVFWSTETTVIPKSTVGKGKRARVFQDFWRVLKSPPSREETKTSKLVPDMNLYFQWSTTVNNIAFCFQG